MSRSVRTSLAPLYGLVLFVVAGIGLPVGAAGQAPIPMDHDVYERWDTIGGETVSRDGRWVMYNRLRYDRDDVLVVRSTMNDVTHVFDRGASGRFDDSSRFLVFNLRPAGDSVMAARRARRPANQMPRDTLAILDLQTGQVTRIAGGRGHRLPEGMGGWLAYQMDRTPPGAGAGQGGAAPGAQAAQGAQGPPGGQGAAAGSTARRRDTGSTLVLRNLASGEERRVEDVAAFTFSSNGQRVAYAVATADGAGDGVFIQPTAGGATVTAMSGEGQYRRLVFDEDGQQLAFLSNSATFSAETPVFALYHHGPRMSAARQVATEGTGGIPAGWQVSENGNVGFSRNGQRIFFGTAPRPEPDVEDGLLPEERVRVEVWHWNEPQIPSVQNRRLAMERRRSFDAVYHIGNNRVVQLGDEAIPSVSVGSRGDADVAIGSAGEQYAVESGWDTPNWADQYLIDVRTGQRTLMRERVQGFAQLSPSSRFAVWYDIPTQAWHAMDLRSRNIVNMTADLPFPIHNEEHDSPSPAGALGTAGWLPNESALLVYDRFDIWAVDPTGRAAPRNITQGAGRAQNIRFRVVRLDREDDYLSTTAPAFLSAFNPRTKQDGFYRVSLSGGTPQQLVMMDYRFSTPRKAQDADVLIFTRQSFTEFPDVWVSGMDVRDMRKLTSENADLMARYRWGTAELVDWVSLDGIELQGIVYKPDNFDPSRKYPMITYFYERMSDTYHLHYPPVPHRSRINPTFYTSRDYIVFVPDIVYRIGYPGESAMNSIMPGVTKLLERPYVDRENLAMQGHSWGGYQIAFMVTRTNMFKAAAPGAPVANMISAYSGIRLESGMHRQFQYERTQSRLGGNLWEMPVRYIENSPVFWLDKVETPLLIMHNDLDGAVPFQQGLELYLGLRRLSKPAWLINYVGEPHWPTTIANKRDWNVRMQQFFDYYLVGAPAPLWLREGVPAIMRDRTLGYETEVITNGGG